MKYILTLLLCLHAFQSYEQRRIDVNVYSSQPPLLLALAGQDQVSPVTGIVLGDNPVAQGGTIPYSYQWLPSIELSDPEAANPTYLGESSQMFTITVTDDRGCISVDTMQIEISIDIAEPLTNDKAVMIYPNPSNGIFRVKVDDRYHLIGNCYSIRQSNGDIVFEGKVAGWDKDLMVDATTMCSGTYYICFDEGENTISRKLVITKK